MGYSNQQKRQHIFELQRYLHAISIIDDSIPNVVPNGVYGAETQSAVRAFQYKYNLTVTGNTTPDTWNKIVQVYKGLFELKPKPYPAFPSEKFVCEKGATGQLVYVIQSLLYGMGKRYDNFPHINVCGHFNDDTVEAVKKFQNICAIPQNGKVDCITWNMLVCCSCHKS